MVIFPWPHAGAWIEMQSRKRKNNEPGDILSLGRSTDSGHQRSRLERGREMSGFDLLPSMMTREEISEMEVELELLSDHWAAIALFVREANLGHEMGVIKTREALKEYYFDTGGQFDEET